MNRLIKLYKETNRLPFWQLWCGLFFGSILSIICNSFNISTLCFWRPLWDIKFTTWMQARMLNIKLNSAMQYLARVKTESDKKINENEKKTLAAIDAGKMKNSSDTNLFS